eukprot:1159241-Pelagomonas_calceolata.AAC.4
MLAAAGAVVEGSWVLPATAGDLEELHCCWCWCCCMGCSLCAADAAVCGPLPAAAAAAAAAAPTAVAVAGTLEKGAGPCPYGRSI